MFKNSDPSRGFLAFFLQPFGRHNCSNLKIIFIFKIPFLIQQVAKFLCLLLGDYQVNMLNPIEHHRTMISFLHLQMVHKHQPDLLNRDPAGLHQKFTTENPTGPRQHWKMSMQKSQNSWERVMPLKK